MYNLHAEMNPETFDDMPSKICVLPPWWLLLFLLFLLLLLLFLQAGPIFAPALLPAVPAAA